MTDEIHQLTSQLTNATNLIHQHIETIQQKQSELANRTEENGQEINVLRTDLTDDLQRLDQKLNSTHEEQLERTSRVQAQLTTQVTRFTNELGTLNQNVRTLQQGQTSLVSRDRALDGKIEQVKQYGHGNRGRIDQLTTKVTTNTNNLRTQISNVRTLQSGQTTSVSRGRALDAKLEQIKRYTNGIKLRPIDSNWRKVKTVTIFSFLKGIINILLQGVLMVKYQGQWGTVCDDGFGSNEARSACHSLGFSGGSHTNYNSGLSASILMDDVDCTSSTQNFLTCTHRGWGSHNCGHHEDVLLTCS